MITPSRGGRRGEERRGEEEEEGRRRTWEWAICTKVSAISALVEVLISLETSKAKAILYGSSKRS